MTDRYARFSRLTTDRPHAYVLRITLNRPGKYNAADSEMHSDMTEVWREIDADPSVNAVLVTGAGKAFSAGGDLDLVGKMIDDFDTRVRVWREAREGYEREHVTPFFYEHPDLFRISSISAPGDYSKYRLTLDTGDDLRLIRTVYASFDNQDNMSWQEIVGLLERSPDLVALNSDVVQKAVREASTWV